MNEIISKSYAVLSDKLGRVARRYWRNRHEHSLLKNKQFTIFSQNCIGSVMYHDLGEQFLSPTVNLMMRPKDFITFLKNIQHYLEQPLTFVDSQKTYPEALLGNDILISFVHYKSNHEAEEAWKRRKERINWQNIFVICCDEGLDEQDIVDFEELPFQNKILFVSQKNASFSGASAVICNEYEEKTDARLLNFSSPSGERFYQKYIDYVAFLNGEDNYRK